jgi:plastocyanin
MARRQPRLLHGLRPARPILALGTALGLLAGCASTGTIQGRVGFVNTPPAETVVLAWPEAGARPALSHERVQVVIRGGRFTPPVVVVRPGATVEFDNRDQVFHVPFSVSPTMPFHLGRCAPGRPGEVTFAQPGVVEVFCELHPAEALYIVVAPDRWYTRPAADGTFVLSGLPGGKYLVRAWTPALGDVTRRVEVAAGRPARVRFGP